MQIQQQQPHSKHTRIISTTNAFTAHIRSFPHQTCIQTTFYFLKRKKSNFFRIIHFGLSIAFENGEQQKRRKKTALRVKQSWIRDSVTIYPTPNCAFPLEILLPSFCVALHFSSIILSCSLLKSMVVVMAMELCLTPTISEIQSLPRLEKQSPQGTVLKLKKLLPPLKNIRHLELQHLPNLR